ncbi:MAG: 23S rRNA (pseudouridine(1915)-N(3))-methyltransferase RlmH [Bacteroidetes bacterium]|nr:23S rRNA (pseudouridine(1915)-N(3))-methyltransferase RlmH [Bacteroidota bacterium]MBS1630260.1 23S rRNA (pseudouridine(1915)-N(3))-methyltransferase RlmH [Bacteroidota bacterium]
MQIEIWSVGKANEAHLAPAIAHYLRKIQPWCKTELQVLSAPQKGSVVRVENTLVAEEALILKRLKPQHYLILLDERGKMLTSPGWADAFQSLMDSGIRTPVLLIGGAYGVSDAVREKAAQVWSLSKLVFPHQLVRLLVAEQLYRAFSILNHSSYHHS